MYMSCTVASNLFASLINQFCYTHVEVIDTVNRALFYVCTYVCIFQPITQEDITGYQVYYNGTVVNVNSSTLTFTAPSLPHDVFTGTVVVMVTATSRYGIGPASDPETAIINGKYVHTMYIPY